MYKASVCGKRELALGVTDGTLESIGAFVQAIRHLLYSGPSDTGQLLGQWRLCPPCEVVWDAALITVITLSLVSLMTR